MPFKVLVRRAWRFSITGVLSTGTHVIVAVAMVNLIDSSQTLANGVAFIVATIFSYFVNTFWSFSASLHEKNLIRYICVAGTGFFMTLGLSSLAEAAEINYLANIALIACALPLVSFGLHHCWTYR